jgi:hypothetical protein
MRLNSYISGNQLIFQFTFTPDDLIATFKSVDVAGRYVIVKGDWSTGIYICDDGVEAKPFSRKQPETQSRLRLSQTHRGGNTWAFQVRAKIFTNAPSSLFEATKISYTKTEHYIICHMPQIKMKNAKIVTEQPYNITTCVTYINQFLADNKEVYVMTEGKLSKSIRLVKQALIDL